MRVTDSCACGATMTMESTYFSEVNHRHQSWLTKHDVCREHPAGDDFERVVLEHLKTLVDRTELTVSLHLPEVVEFLGRAAGYADPPPPAFTTHIYNPAPEPRAEGTDSPIDPRLLTFNAFGATKAEPPRGDHRAEGTEWPDCCDSHYPMGCLVVRCCRNCPSLPGDDTDADVTAAAS